MSHYKKILISFFIFFNLLCMLRIHLPLETKFFSTIYKPVDFYLSFFSIYQDWMMFAKNPSRSNSFLTADVEFIDGTFQTFHFPKSSDLTHFEKYKYGERFRKIISESVIMPNKKFLLKDVARFALRKLKTSHSNKIPKKVYLKKHFFLTPLMSDEFIPHQSTKYDYHVTTIYTHEVI
jgi:hypothetical protein